MAACGLMLAVCGLLASGCGGGSAGGGTGNPGAALVGGFGGAQDPAPGTPALLTLSATGGTLALTCGAGGTLSAPLVPDAAGHASAAGTLRGDTGAPLPGGSPAVPATFTVAVSGDRVTLVVQTSALTSTFTLVRGQTVDLTGGPCPA